MFIKYGEKTTSCRDGEEEKKENNFLGQLQSNVTFQGLRH